MPDRKQFVITRDDVNEFRTYASILVDGVKRWDYLELAWRANVPDQSCIPGNIDYLADLKWSEHHTGPRFWYRDVDGRSACEIHSANIPAQLKGCGAPGKERIPLMQIEGFPEAQDGVGDSREALEEFMTECGIPDFMDLKTPDEVAVFVAANPELCTIAIRLNDPS